MGSDPRGFLCFWSLVFLGTLFLFCVAGFAYTSILLRRNEAVHAYRKNLLNKMRGAIMADILEGKSFEWRFNEFERISYNKMANQFWKPLDSFYKNMSFVEHAKETTTATLEENPPEDETPSRYVH